MRVWPWLCSRAATAEESTPPDMATATVELRARAGMRLLLFSQVCRAQDSGWGWSDDLMNRERKA